MTSTSQRVLHIQPLSKEVEELYSNHGQFHAGDSGLDLFCIEDATIKAGETGFLNLGVKCAAYDASGQNISYLIFPRSSISKTSLRLANSVGLMDAGYRGPIIACLDNIKSEDYSVKKGDRLVQAVFQDLGPFAIKIVDKLSETSRGEQGFGSTTPTPQPTAESTEAKPAEELPAVVAECSAAVAEETAGTGEAIAAEEPKKSDVEPENRPPKEPENRKRNSDVGLEDQKVQAKRPRSDGAKSQEVSQ